MTIEREEGVVLWRQIEKSLAEDIGRRALAPGSQLPPEPSLAERFGVNRHTVRRAVAALARDGLVRIEQGRGTFVQEHAVDYILSRRTRFSQSLLQDRGAKKRLLGSAEAAASAEVARALGLKTGAKVIIIESLAEVDSRVIAHGRHHFPARRFPGIAEIFGEEKSVTRTLARMGVPDYTRKITRITARLPEAPLARLLKQSPTRPVLQTTAVNIDSRGRPVEYGVSHFAGDLVQLVVEPE